MKFNKGDKVQIKTDAPAASKYNGKQGVVVDVFERVMLPYEVEIDGIIRRFFSDELVPASRFIVDDDVVRDTQQGNEIVMQVWLPTGWNADDERRICQLVADQLESERDSREQLAPGTEVRYTSDHWYAVPKGTRGVVVETGTDIIKVQFIGIDGVKQTGTDYLEPV